MAIDIKSNVYVILFNYIDTLLYLGKYLIFECVHTHNICSYYNVSIII